MFQQQDNKADDREVDRMYYEAIDSDLRIELDEEVPAPPVALSFGTHSYTTRYGTKTELPPIATYRTFSLVQAPPHRYTSIFTP